MKIGVAKEVKVHEYRVGLTPVCARSYIEHGHQVRVEQGAGEHTGFTDDDYQAVGAVIEPNKQALFDDCEMIVKVKEPQASEYDLFHEGQILYTYLHLAADAKLTQALLDKKIKGVAYETLELDNGALPCLKPMSEVAGRLAPQQAAKYLEKPFGGRGVLLGGVPGVSRGKVAILGGGVVGTNACKIAVGMGADVTVLDISADRMEYLDDIFGSSITTLYSTPANIEKVLSESDAVIGAVLVAGKKAPRLISKAQLSLMKPGAVIVDVAIDQGGCVETSRATTHDDPVYEVDGIVHYCVANIPGAVPLTSTLALTGTTLSYGLTIADLGLEAACRQSTSLSRAVNVYQGCCVYENVATDLDLPYTALSSLL